MSGPSWRAVGLGAALGFVATLWLLRDKPESPPPAVDSRARMAGAV